MKALRDQDRITKRALRTAGLALAQGPKTAVPEWSIRMAILLGLFAYGPAWFGFFAAYAWDLPWSAGLAIGAGVLGLFWLAILSSVRPVAGTFRHAHNHGAEHMVLDAWNRHGRRWKNALGESRHRVPRCGTTYVVWQVMGLFALAVVTWWAPLPTWGTMILLTAGLLVWPALVAEALSHDRLSNLLAAPGLLGQRVSTRRPDPEDLELAVAAADVLFGLDPVPERRGPQGRPSDLVRPTVVEQHDTWAGPKRTWGKIGAVPSALVGAFGFARFLVDLDAGAPSIGTWSLALAWLGLTIVGWATAAVLALRSGLLRPARNRRTAPPNREARPERVPHARWFRILTLAILIGVYTLVAILTLIAIMLAMDPGGEGMDDISPGVYFAAVVISWICTAGFMLLLAVGLHVWRRRGRRPSNNPLNPTSLRSAG